MARGANTANGSFLLPALLFVLTAGYLLKIATGWPLEYVLYFVLGQALLLIACAMCITRKPALKSE